MIQSFSAAALITAMSLGLLILAVSRLGRAQGMLAALQMLGLVTLKFALLALGFSWMSKQPWFDAKAAALGAALPLIALIFWKRNG